MDYMRVVLNSFTWKRTSSPFFANKKIFRQTLADPMFIFSGTCWPRLVRKTLMCDLRKFVPGVCSLVTLHSVAAAPKHLRFALRCWSLLTFIRRNYSIWLVVKMLVPELGHITAVTCDPPYNYHVGLPYLQFSKFQDKVCFVWQAQ